MPRSKISLASAAITGALPTANGGTGTTDGVDLTNLSASNLTSGTIPNARYGTPTFSAANLTSLPAPTSAQVASANAGISANSVGSYGLMRVLNGYINSNNDAYPPHTASGSALYFANARGEHSGSGQASGTWRIFGKSEDQQYQYYDGKTTLWMRIS